MKGGVEVIFGSCWKVEEEVRELGQAGTLAYSNCYRERKKKTNREKKRRSCPGIIFPSQNGRTALQSY